MNEKILTVAVIGYGSRGNVYTNYMKELGTMRTVCVCEPNEKKRELAAQRLSLGEEALFADENEFLRSAGRTCSWSLLPTALITAMQ